MVNDTSTFQYLLYNMLQDISEKKSTNYSDDFSMFAGCFIYLMFL